MRVDKDGCSHTINSRAYGRTLNSQLKQLLSFLSSVEAASKCGQELRETLLNLAHAWESADTSKSSFLAKQLPLLETYLTERGKAAFGKRLLSTGRRFQSMGQYGQGEPGKIAKSMMSVGKLLSATAVPATEEPPKVESRTFKFRELQVEVTPEKVIIGAVIAVAFGILSWQVSQRIQSVPDGELQYANDNALLLAN